MYQYTPLLSLSTATLVDEVVVVSTELEPQAANRITDDAVPPTHTTPLLAHAATAALVVYELYGSSMHFTRPYCAVNAASGSFR